MVDADERLTALKKAYADIILNTAKEAAARIIQSERKALRLQHELNASKEQALQVVLRLKRMMDSKVTEASEMAYLSQQKRIGELEGRLRDAENKIGEAEATSLTQQRKAELLEAQLQEAEDIVHDLRTELSEVQDELERVRNEKSRDIAECGTGTQVQASEERSHSSPPQTISSFTTPVVNNSSLQQINEAYNCNEGNDNFPESCSGGKPDILSVSEENTSNYVFPPELLNVSAMKHPALNQITQIHPLHGENSVANRPKIPSVVLRTKEAEPYRNRRTQRIRAFEEKLMAGELSFSDTVAATYVATGREGEGIHIATLQKSGNMCSTDEKDEGEAENPKETVNKANHVLVKQRKRKNKLRNLSNVLERDQTSSIMSAEGNFINRNGGNPSKTLPKVSAEIEDQREIVKIRKTRETDEVSRSKQLPATPENGHEESSDIVPNKRNIEKKESKGSRSNKMKYGKSFRQKWRKCKKTSRILLVETDQTPDTTSTETNPEENQAILLRCTKRTVNDAVVVQGSSSLNNTNPDQASVNKSVPINLEKKASDDMVFFKHTFQRKRKRNTLIGSNSNVSLETSILEGKTAEEQNDNVAMKNPTSTTEPSPHSGRVAEVARQLISLSDKKW